MKQLLPLLLGMLPLVGVAQASNELARNLCGSGEGQNSLTPGTLYHNVLRVRDLLLTVHTGNEEQLGLWGYDVRVK